MCTLFCLAEINKRSLLTSCVIVLPRTPTLLVYWETGRYPLYICSYRRCIQYWLSILRMQEDRISLKFDKMLYNMHCNNKNNWTSSVCFSSYRHGFGRVWENQGVCEMYEFSRMNLDRELSIVISKNGIAVAPLNIVMFLSLHSNKHMDCLNTYLLSKMLLWQEAW